MKKQVVSSIGVSVAVYFATAVAFAAPTQLLSNPGFENPLNPASDWTVDSYAWRSTTTDWWYGDPSHPVYLLNNSGSNVDWGVAQQEVTVTTAGDFNLLLSFWAWVRSTGYRPSFVGGELLVNEQVVAAAVKSAYTAGTYPYTQVWASWSGHLSVGDKIKVRLTLLADGCTGLAAAAVDDVQLLASACSEQPDVSDAYVTGTDPHEHAMNLGSVPNPFSLTLAGTNLTNVAKVTLRGAGTNGCGYVYPDQGGLIKSATSLTATFDLTGASAGLYDVIAEPAVGSDCTAVVIARAFQILDAAAEQNLLGNPSFEVVKETLGNITAPDNQMTYTYSDAVGGAAMWFGDYIKDPAMNPSPQFIDFGSLYFGIWGTWSNSRGESGTETTNTWQTVAVAPGSTVHFEGWLDCNVQSAPSTSSATVNLWDGAIGSTLIGTASIDETTPGSDPGNPLHGTWVQKTITGTSNSGQVTVQLTTSLTVSGFVAAVFADAFKLTVNPICSAPLNPWIAYPANSRSNTDPTVTITGGSNLDEVAAVSLIHLTNRATQPDTVVPGTVLSQTPTKLVVRFPLETNDAPTGTYNLVLEKPSSPPANLAFYRIQPPRTIGAGLSTGAPDWLPARFYPNVPATFANGFNFQPLLLNGDFEADGRHTTRDVPIPQTSGWRSLGSTTPVYNGSTHNPGDADQPPWGYNLETDNRGSVSEGATQSTARIVQDGIPVRPNYHLNLTGWIYGGCSAGPHIHQVLIHDGDANGPVIGQYQLPDAGGGFQTGWQAVSIVDALPTSSQVTVEWGHIPNGSTTWGVITTHVDQLLLAQDKATCNPVFADADGDGDVDQADFAAFQECFTGDTGTLPSGSFYDCGCFDVAGSTNKITQADLAVFEQCATGPGIPAAYDCGG
jgi:hypothetical protein